MFTLNKDAKCFKCNNIQLYFYDGCLGYESVKCRNCGTDQADESIEERGDDSGKFEGTEHYKFK